MADYSSIQKKIMMDRAKSAVLSRDYQLAARLYKGLLQTDPENIELLSALGDLYERSGRDNESLPFYRSIVNIDPSNVNALNSLGGIYRRLGRFDESIDVLQKAIIADEHNPQIYYNLGSAYNLKGRYDNAIYCFTKVIESKPDDVLAYNHLGHVYAKQKQYEKAISTYAQGLKIDPNHPVLHLNLAKCYEKIGAFEKSSMEFENALRYKPNWNDAIEGYADLLMRNNHSRSAKELVQQAIKLNPGNMNMHKKMGDVYAHQHNYAMAEHEYQSVIEKDPKNKNALSGLADVYESSDKLVEALHTMKQLDFNYPDDVDVMEQHAHVLLSANKVNSASKIIKKVWDKNQKDEDLLNLLGQYYIVKGDDGKALGCYKRIEELNPYYKEYLKDGAQRYAQIGRTQKALDYGEKYLSEYPHDSKALFDVAKNLEKLERNEEAISKYQELMEQDEDNIEYKSGLKRLQNRIAGFETEEEKTSEIVDGIAVDENIEDFAADFMDESETSDEKEFNEVVNDFDSDVVPEEAAQSEELPSYEPEFSFDKLQEDDVDAGKIFKNLDDEIKADETLKDDEEGVDLDDLVDKDAEDDFFSSYPNGKENGSGVNEEDDLVDAPEFENEDIDDFTGIDKGQSYEIPDGLSQGYQEEAVPEETRLENPWASKPVANASSEPKSDFATNPFKQPESKEPVMENMSGFEPEVMSSAEPDNTSEIMEPETEMETSGFEPMAMDPVAQEDTSLQGDDLALYEEEDNLADFGNIPGLTEPGEEEVPMGAGGVVEKVKGELAENAAHHGEELALSDEENNLADFEDKVTEDQAILAEYKAQEREQTALDDEENNLADFESSISSSGKIAEEPCASEENNLSEGQAILAEYKAQEREMRALEDEEKNLLDFVTGSESESFDSAVSENTFETDEEDSSSKEKGKLQLIAELFLELKEMSSYLPTDKKEEFLSSEEYIKLEYLIGKLTGHPGLLATAEEIRRRLGIEDSLESVTATGDELIRAVFAQLKSMIGALPDKAIARTLDMHVESAMNMYEE